MQVTELKNEGLKREFKVILPVDNINKDYDKKLQEIASTIKMPGFRPGKVPKSFVKKKHGKIILNDVLQNAVTNATKKIFSDKNITPAMQPKIDISEFDEKKDLEYKIELELFPEIPNIDLTKIKVKKSVVEISEKEVDEGIKKLQKIHQEIVPAKTKRATKKGDIVEIDFEGKVDGKAFPGGTAKKYKLELGSGQFIPGFEDQLISAKKGDKVEVNVEFPKDYFSKDMAGKKATFDVSVNEVFDTKLPTLNDEFAKKTGYEDVNKLKDGIKKQVESDFKTIIDTKVKKELFDQLEKEFNFTVPEGMIDLEVKTLIDQDRYSGLMIKDCSKEYEEKEKEYKKVAKRRVGLGLLLADIGKKVGIEITEDELRQAVMKQARLYPGQEQKVIEMFQKNPLAIENLKGPILESKVVDHILTKIQIEIEKTTIKKLIDFSESKDF